MALLFISLLHAKLLRSLSRSSAPCTGSSLTLKCLILTFTQWAALSLLAGLFNTMPLAAESTSFPNPSPVPGKKRISWMGHPTGLSIVPPSTWIRSICLLCLHTPQRLFHSSQSTAQTISWENSIKRYLTAHTSRLALKVSSPLSLFTSPSTISLPPTTTLPFVGLHLRR